MSTLALIARVIFNLGPIYADKRGDVGDAVFSNYINLNCYYITRGPRLVHRRKIKMRLIMYYPDRKIKKATLRSLYDITASVLIVV